MSEHEEYSHDWGHGPEYELSEEELKKLHEFASISTEPPTNETNSADSQKELEAFDNKSKLGVKKAKQRVFIISIYMLWLMAVCVLMIRLIHFILPEFCQWLSVEQLQSLDKFLFSGAIGGVLGKYGAKVAE